MNQKTYHDYPENYLHAIEHFADTSAPELTFKMKLRSAQALRRDLYRFFPVLSRAGDELSARLFSIAKDLSISVRPQDVDPEDEVTLTIYRNPLTQIDFPGAKEAPVMSKGESSDLYSLDEIEAAMSKKKEQDD